MILDDRLPPRIQELLIPVPWSGCWLFVGHRESRNGYARVWWDGQELQLHRVVFTLIRGPFPAELLLDHRCRVRPCCNPWHLEPVTDQVNVSRGAAILFRPKGELPCRI